MTTRLPAWEPPLMDPFRGAVDLKNLPAGRYDFKYVPVDPKRDSGGEAFRAALDKEMRAAERELKDQLRREINAVNPLFERLNEAPRKYAYLDGGSMDGEIMEIRLTNGRVPDETWWPTADDYVVWYKMLEQDAEDENLYLYTWDRMEHR